MVRLSSTQAAVAALADAKEVRAYAYTLRAGPVERALEAAARRGAHVTVRLESHPYGKGGDGLAKVNQRVVDRLREAGADAALDREQHVKALAVDGELFLDGRNWGEDDFVVRDDDRAGLATTKRNALAAEAALLATASRADRVLVESESFGAGNPVYSALDALARRGAAPRLLVGARVLARNHRERATLERLQRDGVDVRVCKDSEKFALAGDRAWVGSANASFDGGRDDMTDWGLATANRSVVSAARARLEARWQNATRQAFVQR